MCTIHITCCDMSQKYSRSMFQIFRMCSVSYLTVLYRYAHNCIFILTQFAMLLLRNGKAESVRVLQNVFSLHAILSSMLPQILKCKMKEDIFVCPEHIVHTLTFSFDLKSYYFYFYL